jgi:hypothetical protein
MLHTIFPTSATSWKAGVWFYMACPLIRCPVLILASGKGPKGGRSPRIFWPAWFSSVKLQNDAANALLHAKLLSHAGNGTIKM